MEAIKEGLLKVDPGLFLWTIITFLVLLLILWKTAWKPIVEALESRSEKVRGDVEKAEKARFESEELLAQHKAMTDNAKEESRKIIEESKSHAEKMKNDILDKAQEEAQEIIVKAKKEINIAKDKALSELQVEVVNLSTDIAAKIIARELNPEDQIALVEEALNNLDKMKSVQ